MGTRFHWEGNIGPLQAFLLRCNIRRDLPDGQLVSRIVRIIMHGYPRNVFAKSSSAKVGHRDHRSTRFASYAAAGLIALAASAGLNKWLAVRAERRNPARGQFISVNGVRLHYVDQGQGDVLVLLHGNGSMIEDFESSGLIREASKRFRVIAFDRPGFGHSDRPKTTNWTPDAQAALFKAALTQLGITQSIVVGHSWGCSVAIAMGLRHPEQVKALVLASGYYYPSARLDVVPMSFPAVPVIGDLIRWTLAPMLSRLLWPVLLRKMFGPATVPAKFSSFPEEMAFRPSQIGASAAETAMMIPNATKSCSHYPELEMPVVIIAGGQDRLIDADDQSARLHGDVANSTFHRVAGSGHMVHQTATLRLMAAIDEAEGLTKNDRVHGTHEQVPQRSRPAA
ncbi:alpha/beta fold hydrolase [Prosthecomicrobium sp. N25]|uniref:alpha/beta fold hydrolase n=1 Tax=Prosthecomicrobium sp. N25 TaxID=3129254 RepID=UPI0030785A29